MVELRRSKRVKDQNDGAPVEEEKITKKSKKVQAEGNKKETSSKKETATAAASSTKKGASKGLAVGDQAPDFSVTDQDGKECSLKDFEGKYVVIYFYPKDNTPGCTKEGCRFNELNQEFKEKDTVILGVSADSEKAHKKFVDKYSFSFSLLADTSKTLIKAYGASKGDNIQRSTVLIDKEGKVAAVWNPVKGAATHPDEVLAKLKEICGDDSAKGGAQDKKEEENGQATDEKKEGKKDSKDEDKEVDGEKENDDAKE